MATKRLIPYSVHLPEDVYEKLKKMAAERQASAMVRDAIQMLFDESSSFGAGYNKGLRDAMSIIENDKVIKGLSINNKMVVNTITNKIGKLIVKEKSRGNSKKS